MIIVISGNPGCGKTTISKILIEKIKEEKNLNFTIISLNELAKKYKIKNINELQTFDFNIEKLLNDFEKDLEEKYKNKNLIIEGHFSHLINPDLVKYCFIINRDKKKLLEEYKKRNYNQKKIDDNIECENFNICYYEGIEEGYKEEKQIFCFLNDNLNNCIK